MEVSWNQALVQLGLSPLNWWPTEVTNQTLTTLLRRLISKSLKEWDLKLPHAEFAYTRSPAYATKHSPFDCVYGVNPLTPLDMVPIPTEAETRAKEMRKLHE